MRKQTWGDRIKKDMKQLVEDSEFYDAQDVTGLPLDGAADLGLSFIGRALLSNLIPDIESAVSQTKSPIEEAMLTGLLIAGLFRCQQVRIGGERQPIRFGRDTEMVPDILTITPQAKIGKYRADFMLTARNRWGYDNQYSDGSILVECDGHDYHERTKEQAKRDKQRDRELQSAGFEVHHFTGSEIWDQPLTYAVGAVERVIKVAWEVSKARLGND